MSILAEAVRLVEPWAAAYNDTPLLQTATTFAHFGGFMLGGGFAIATDAATLRAARVGAPRRRRQLSYLRHAHRAVVAGLAVTFSSGLLMFAADLEALAASPAFWAKMLLVMLLLVNGLVMTVTESALRTGRGEIDRLWRRLRRTAICSFALWFAAVLAGTVLVNAGQ